MTRYRVYSQTHLRREGVALPSKLQAEYFYHGTNDEKAARKILASCNLIGRVTQGRRLDTSIPNRVYITPMLWHALYYVLNKHGLPSKSNYGYGYLFAVRRQDLVDVWLDEDFVSEMICNVEVPWLVMLFEQLIDRYPKDFAKVCGKLSKSKFLDLFNACGYPQTAQAGKFILQHTDKATKGRMISEWLKIGPADALALSHTGAVPISKAWRIKTEHVAEVLHTYPNEAAEKLFMNLAEEIPLRC